MSERHRRGPVRDAVVEYLSNQTGDARVRAIQDAAASTLGGELAGVPVRSYPRLSEGKPFDRTGHGRCRLRRS